MQTYVRKLSCWLTVAVLLAATGAPAQNLFVSDADSIVEITPTDVQTAYATGLNDPRQIAFNGTGDLFVPSYSGGTISEISPGQTPVTFYSGLNPVALAFNSAGDLFQSDYSSDNIYEYTPGGKQSLFASGLNGPRGVAFNRAGDLFVANP